MSEGKMFDIEVKSVPAEGVAGVAGVVVSLFAVAYYLSRRSSSNEEVRTDHGDEHTVQPAVLEEQLQSNDNDQRSSAYALVAYVASYSWPLAIPMLGPLAGTAMLSTSLVKYGYPCYRLLEKQFSNQEMTIVFPATTLLCSTLFGMGLGQYVDIMLSDSLLIQDSLKRIVAALEKKEMLSDDTVKGFLSWMISDCSKASFNERFSQHIALMLVSPVNRFLVGVTSSVEQAGSTYKQTVGFLKGLAFTFVPPLQYMGILSQSTEYLVQEKSETVDWKDLMSGGISFVVHYFFGNSPAVHRVLAQGLLNVKKVNAKLPSNDAQLEDNLVDWVKKGESFLARLLHLSAHYAQEGAVEAVFRAPQFSQLLPKTFSSSFVFVNMFFISELSYPAKFVVSYILSYSFEKTWSAEEAQKQFELLHEAEPLRHLLMYALSKTGLQADKRFGFLSDFLDETGSRPAHFKIMDLFLTLGIMKLKSMLQKIVDDYVSPAVRVIASWIVHFYEDFSQFFVSIYCCIQSAELRAKLFDPDFLINLGSLVPAFGGYFSAAKEEVETVMPKIDPEVGKAVEQEGPVEVVTPESDLEAGKVLEQEDQRVLDQDYSEAERNASVPSSVGVFAFTEEESLPSQFSASNTIDGWLTYGAFFTDNPKKDHLRNQLIRLQIWANGFYEGWGESKLFDDLDGEWELIDTTHMYATPIPEWLRKTRGFCKKSFTGSNFSNKYEKKFKKMNPRNYRGVALKRKDGLVVIATSGTEMMSVGNLRADHSARFSTRHSNKYCRAGKFFADHVMETYLEGRSPDIFVAHSLGCTFNLYMRAVTGGGSYILNVDAFGNSASKILRRAWQKYQPGKPIDDSNIDTIIGSPSFFNNHGKGHVGQVLKLDTSEGSSLERSIIAPAGNFTRHEIARISAAYDKMFNELYYIDAAGDPRQSGARLSDHKREKGVCPYKCVNINGFNDNRFGSVARKGLNR